MKRGKDNELSKLELKVLFAYDYLKNKDFLKRRRGKNYGRFLKMIDDLQTPKHKTNHKYRSYFPLLSFTIEIKPTIKSIQI